jgi:hypothetical protein
MKEIFKPYSKIKAQKIMPFCEVDCACWHVKCNKDCQGAGAPNSSILENEDLLL